ncbi:MAG: ATP-binding protein, partial [Acidobacteria bacterium]|nr:ATP-binding protein [Acidobacteriota bacterium]
MDESARLAALRSYRILDTDPEQGFDDLALLASQVCGTPIGTITLLDEDRQWFKARVGLTETEIERSVSFCSHAIQRPEIMVVQDALDDERFSHNPLVLGEPHIRFYAGAPLVTPEGAAIGTLCVIDRVPRQLNAAQVRALHALQRQAQAQLELRRNLLQLAGALAARDQAEAAQSKLVEDLRQQLDNVNKLSGLMQFCSTCHMNLTLPAVPDSIERVSEGIVQLLQGKGWSEAEIIKVDLALQEALANGIRHGCKGDPTKFVQCIVTTDAAGDLMVVVRDPGTGFDPAAVANPLDGENILKTSGRGVFLINQLMDEVAFADGGREVQMRKRK